MPATITHAGVTLTPELVLGLADAAESGNVFHKLLSGTEDLTTRPAGPRNGTLGFLFLDEASVDQAFQLHREAGTFTLVYPERPTWNITYAPDGRISRELDPETSRIWTLTVGFREVTP
ncbi:hypothetical protein KXS11_03450 [Plantibacter flavus]|uniref:hypothetical protein n=1 Tax=Plantibacter flavus TaxID=150123 RepID=UPI003F192AD1